MLILYIAAQEILSRSLEYMHYMQSVCCIVSCMIYHVFYYVAVHACSAANSIAQYASFGISVYIVYVLYNFLEFSTSQCILFLSAFVQTPLFLYMWRTAHFVFINYIYLQEIDTCALSIFLLVCSRYYWHLLYICSKNFCNQHTEVLGILRVFYYFSYNKYRYLYSVTIFMPGKIYIHFHTYCLTADIAICILSPTYVLLELCRAESIIVY